jgi:RNase P/RNase MRP subunit p29
MTTTGTIVVANDDDAVWTRPDAGAASYDLTATSTLTYNDNQWHQLIITRTNASDVDAFIDGAALNLSNATGNTLTIDDAQGQVVTIGASCSTTTGANCAAANATNFWDGAIDDVQFAVGTAAQATTTTYMARRHYNMERPRVNKRIFTVTDATSATSTSLTDTGESWLMNELAGQVVEVTGSTDADCVGVTRRIVSNTATSLTFTPAVPGACTLDTSADFEIDPEALYGATDSVYAIGITAESPLGEARQMCVGTNNGSDAGGVTCYNHQAGPSVVADIYNTQASKTDDFGTDWTGTDYDDIRSIDLSGRALIMASEAHITMQTEDVRLGQGLDYLSYQIWHMRNEILNDGIFANGAIGPEVGFTGGADLAERYYSNESLAAGELVAIDQSLTAGVKKTAGRYQRDVLGVVATEPGLILGAEAENGYPIALVGRVPVRVTNENGQIYAGDRITASSKPGYGMFASQAGRVIGQALSDAVDWTVCEGEDPLIEHPRLCTTVLVFVNLADYSGVPVELAMSRMNSDGATDLAVSAGLESDSSDEALVAEGATVRLATAEPTREEKILAYLKKIRDADAVAGRVSSEIFTGRISASTEVITPTLYADQIFAKSIKADSIEGLQIWTDQISSLSEKYAGLNTLTATTNTHGATSSVVAEQQALAIAMKNLSADTVTVQLDGSILGKLTVAGALRIGGDAQFDGNTVFAKLATFLGTTWFKGTVDFEKAPIFGSDTAGFALIEKGARRVRVNFDEAYEKQPIVAVTLTNDKSPLLDETADADLRADVALVEADYVDTVFRNDVRYIVTEKDKTGFTIVLGDKAPYDIHFSWVAIAVRVSKTSISETEMTPPEETLSSDVSSTVSTMPSVPVNSTSPETTDTQPADSTATATPTSVPSTTSAMPALSDGTL